jgi:hypothetical protein
MTAVMPAVRKEDVDNEHDEAPVCSSCDIFLATRPVAVTTAETTLAQNARNLATSEAIALTQYTFCGFSVM